MTRAIYRLHISSRSGSFRFHLIISTNKTRKHDRNLRILQSSFGLLIAELFKFVTTRTAAYVFRLDSSNCRLGREICAVYSSRIGVVQWPLDSRTLPLPQWPVRYVEFKLGYLTPDLNSISSLSWWRRNKCKGDLLKLIVARCVQTNVEEMRTLREFPETRGFHLTIMHETCTICIIRSAAAYLKNLIVENSALTNMPIHDHNVIEYISYFRISEMQITVHNARTLKKYLQDIILNGVEFKSIMFVCYKLCRSL